MIIRRAREQDLQRIYEIERHSYPSQLQTTDDVLAHRFKKFGIWVAESDENVIGFFTCVPAMIDWPYPDIDRIIQHRHPDYMPWFEEYGRGGEFNTLWVTSTAVEDKYQGRGAGAALVNNSVKLAKDLGFQFRGSALRCEYGKFHERTKKPIDEYFELLEKGDITERFIEIYRRRGFELIAPLPDYEPNDESMNLDILAVKNISY
jgi:GNAT superfamily N-acetyltransferase